MFSCIFCLIFVFVTANVRLVVGWTTDEMGIFDLVEELNINFYTFLELERGATTQEIRKAYRKQSLLWHPDKNDSPDAANKFRQLAAVYDILKDETLRKAYEEVLDNGLPTWRQPIYYYRRMRKMPWWELFVLVCLICTIGHYLVVWGAYFERRLTIEEEVATYIRKKEKRLKRKNIDVDKMISDEVEIAACPKRPGWNQLLPFVLARAVMSIPSLMRAVKETYDDVQRAKQEKQEEEQRLEEERKEIAEAKEAKKLNRQKKKEEMRKAKPVVEPTSTLKPVVYRSQQSDSSESDEDFFENFIQTGDWSVNDVVSLIRYAQKYPVGTPRRWEKIAEHLSRRPNDVTEMHGRLKHLRMTEYEKLLKMAQSNVDISSDNLTLPSNDISTKETQDDATNSNSQDIDNSTCPDATVAKGSWSVAQQKSLEQALVTFPKGTDQRWERIAEVVPGKTKDECIARYKELAEVVRRKRDPVSDSK